MKRAKATLNARSEIPTTPGSVIRSLHPVDLKHDQGIRVAVGDGEFLRPSDCKRYSADIYWTFDVIFDAGNLS